MHVHLCFWHKLRMYRSCDWLKYWAAFQILLKQMLLNDRGRRQHPLLLEVLLGSPPPMAVAAPVQPAALAPSVAPHNDWIARAIQHMVNLVNSKEQEDSYDISYSNGPVDVTVLVKRARSIKRTVDSCSRRDTFAQLNSLFVVSPRSSSSSDSRSA
jgi:hypothetical protein